MSISIDLAPNWIVERQLELLKVLIDATDCPKEKEEYQKQINEIEKEIQKTLNY
jgi:hypothetical protein